MIRFFNPRSNSAYSEPPGAPPDNEGANAEVETADGNMLNRSKLVLVTSLYVAAFLWVYATIVSPTYAYDGCTLTWPGVVGISWLVILSVLPALFLPYSISRPSALVIWWLYLSVYVPSILIPQLSLSMTAEQLFPLQISLLLSLALLCVVRTGRVLAIPQIAISPALFWPAFVLVWGSCIGYIFISGHFSVLVNNVASLFESATIYTLRGDYRDLVLETGRLLAYVIGQMEEALNPFLIAFGLIYRRKLCVIAGIFGQIAVFSLTGFKASLLSYIFLAVLALIVKRWRRSFGLVLTSGLIATILLCAVVDRATGNIFFTSIVTRRTLVVPGLLTGFYYEHYSKVSPTGIGFHFTHDQAFFGPANEIGLAYFGNSEVNANANLWAESFAELGFPGILGCTILVALLIWLFDSIAARRDPTMAVLLVAMPTIMLSNTAPTTVLISHGGLAAALVLFLAPSPQPSRIFEPEIAREEATLMAPAGSPV